MRTIPFSVVGLCIIRTLLGLKNLPADPLFSLVVTDRSAQIFLFLSERRLSCGCANGESFGAEQQDVLNLRIAPILAGALSLVVRAYIKPRGFFKESERALSFGRNVPFR